MKWKSDGLVVYLFFRSSGMVWFGLVWVVYNGGQAVHMSVYDVEKETAPAVKEIPPLLSGFFEREISARWDMTKEINKPKRRQETLVSIDNMEADRLETTIRMLILFIDGAFLTLIGTTSKRTS